MRGGRKNPQLKRVMATHVKIAHAFLGNKRRTFSELLRETGLSRRALARTLKHLVAAGLLEKTVLSHKRVFYSVPDPYFLDLMTRWDWHELGRPPLVKYREMRDRMVAVAEEAGKILHFFAALALSQPKARAGIEGGGIVLYLKHTGIPLDDEEFRRGLEEEYGVPFTVAELFGGKTIPPEAASPQIKAKARLEYSGVGEQYYRLPPILPKINLGRCLETWCRAFGLLVGSEKDVERWGIRVGQDALGYYNKDWSKVREIKDRFRITYNEHSRKATIEKISALANLLWLNKERLAPYITRRAIIV